MFIGIIFRELYADPIGSIFVRKNSGVTSAVTVRFQDNPWSAWKPKFDRLWRCLWRPVHVEGQAIALPIWFQKPVNNGMLRITVNEIVLSK